MEMHRISARPRFFMDETYIDVNSQPTSFLTNCTIESADDARAKGLLTGLKWNPSRGNRLLILGMIGPEGVVHETTKIWIRSDRKVMTEDYHNDIDSKTYYEWLKNVLPYLPQNAILVIDNASIHNKRSAGTPTSQTIKQDMQNWLISKNINFSPNALKAELWEIIKEKLKSEPEYDIDKMVKKIRKDITLERLPPYHCELNPIEMVWGILKRDVRKSPFKHVQDVKKITESAFQKITPEMVQNCIDHVEEQEAWYRSLHKLEPIPVETIDSENATTLMSSAQEQISDQGIVFNEEGQILTPSDKSAIEVIVTIPDSPLPYKCSFCDFTSESESKCIQHIKSHKSCRHCGKVFHGINSSRNYKSHLKTHEAKEETLYYCKICEKSFLRKISLVQHIKHDHESKIVKKIDFEFKDNLLPTKNDVKSIPDDQMKKDRRKQKIIPRCE